MTTQLSILYESSGEVLNIQAQPNDTIQKLKSFIQERTNIHPSQQSLIYESKTLLDHETLASKNIANHDIILLRQTTNVQPSFSSPSNEPSFSSHTDIESQKRMEEIIRRRNIEENMANALEYTPEAFARVVMLYIDCKVNGVPMKAFVDSGAQTTIMSRDCAKRVGIYHLLDERFAGVAMGVGTARILGRIHLTTMTIGNTHFPLSITVLDQGGLEFLLGLDQLRRHQCSIDLAQNCLHIGNEKAKFLSEGELPNHIRLEEDKHVHEQVSQRPPDALVRQLMSFGFSRERVLEALRVTNNDPNMAASMLIGSVSA
jgi:hypothetical protein